MKRSVLLLGLLLGGCFEPQEPNNCDLVKQGNEKWAHRRPATHNELTEEIGGSLGGQPLRRDNGGEDSSCAARYCQF